MRSRTEWIENLLNRFPEDQKKNARVLLSDYWEYAKSLSVDLRYSDITPAYFTLGGMLSLIAVESLTCFDPATKAVTTVAGSLVISELCKKWNEKKATDQSIMQSSSILYLARVLKEAPESLSENLAELRKQLNLIKKYEWRKRGMGVVGAGFLGFFGYRFSPSDNYSPSDHGVIAAASANALAMIGKSAAQGLARAKIFGGAPDFKEEGGAEPASTNGLRQRTLIPG